MYQRSDVIEEMDFIFIKFIADDWMYTQKG